MQRLTKSLSEKMILLSVHQTEREWTFHVRSKTSITYEQHLTETTFSCSCPDHQGKKTFCKHLLFLVARVACQMELAMDIHKKPKTAWKETAYRACMLSWTNRLGHLINSGKHDVIEGECCICFEKLESAPTVQCVRTCKNWFHEECITSWKEHGSTTCPLCRTEWNNVSELSEPVEQKIQGSLLQEEKESSAEDNEKDIETDIIFSFDTTGSMSPCISEVRRNVANIISKLFTEIRGLRVSIISHGDYCDKENTISVLDFTSNQHDIITFINQAKATSGGDYPECYELVLRTAKTLSWRTDAKMKSLILIGDAPPHEKNENPEKIDWRLESEALANRNIQVFSVQCLNSGNREAYAFYSEVARVTNGYHMFLDQFSYIKDMIQAICFRQYNVDQLEKFEEEVQHGSGGMSNTLRLMFDTLLGKKSREEVEREMNPDRFRERYHRSASAAVARSHHTEAAAPSLDRESELRPCHPSKFQVFTVDEDCGIKEFCVKMGISFVNGRGFYEFIKNEIIQPKKEIILMDKNTGELYEGDVARTIAGIKANEERSKIKPGDLPKYRVFIQSTSVQRKLLKNQGFLYEVPS